MTALLLLLQPLSSCSSRSSATPPPRDVTSILGVNTHSGTSAAARTPDGELDLIQAAGIAWIRDDISWALVEPERGRYDFAATDGLFHALAARNLGFIAILGDLNTQWTAGGAGPHLTNATTIAAFARFAAAVATRYSRDNPRLLLELINEPNTMGGYANASLYAEVATAAGGAIHAAGGKVAAPACANADPDWLRRVFDGGLLEVTDTLTLHPYRATAPETAMATYDTVRELVSRYSPITRRVQIAQGEVGYGQGGASADPITPTQKAKLAVRMFLTSIASGVYPAIWYDWKQPHTECTNASYTGECMGLIDDAQPPVLQPAYHAVQTLHRNLQGLHFVASPATCQSDPCVVSDDDYALTFKNATHIGVVVWSVLPFKHNIQLLFAAGCFSVMEWLGTPLPEICSSHTHQQHLNVYVTDSPLYLSQRLKSDNGDAASFFRTAPAPVQQPEPRAFEPIPPPTALKVDDTGTNSEAARPPPAGCGLPQWQSSWSMAGSLYAYCIGQCAIKWLANHMEHGRFAGVVGIDHYWTHQGMPCIDGQPREFAMQDELAKSIKTSNPGTRVLEYRIDDAVSYDPVVHNKMLSDPAAFVRWHHKPHNNGSICENWDVGAFVDPTRINNPKNNCSFHISSSAYDYTQPAVRTWYLDNIIKPTMNVGDGAWLDGDGPDNGAWMCTAGTHGNLRNKSKNGYTKISALNDSEAQAYATAKILVTSQAREWLIAHKGFEYTCFDFVSNVGQLPVVEDDAFVCSSKIRALNSSRDWPSSGGGSYRPATVYYGSRVGDCGCYDSATVNQAAAVFMLTRHQHDLFHLPHNMSLTDAEARALLRDDGAPLGGMLEPTTGVFERRFEKTTVHLDCANFTARFLSVAEHGAVPPQKLDDDKGSIHKGVAAAAASVTIDDSEQRPRKKGTARLSLGPLLADGMVFPSGNGTAAGDGVAASALVIVNFTRAGSTVIARGNADARGSWAIHLQLSPSLTPGSMTVTSGNDSLDLRDVLIGALILCSGQSNMVFPLAAISCDRNADPSMASLGCQPVWSNGTAAVNASVTYTPRIRLATTTVTPAPQGKFLSKPWAPASPSTVGTFSAECYLSATRLADQRPKIPLGLVQSARSGSPVQYWMSNESLVACPVANTHRYIYAEQRLGWLSAIHPMANVQFAAVLWHQGEANSFEPEIYSCLFKSMIASWRQLFRNPTLPFVFVQLQPCSISLEHRLAQADALTLPGVGMATAIDLGDRGVGNGAYGECHSRYKEAVAVRAALELRRLVYGDKVSSEGPVLAKVSTERRVAKDRHSPTGESTSFVTVLTFTTAAGMHLGPTVDSLIGCGLPASQEVFMMQSTPTEHTGSAAGVGEGRPWLDISVSARNGSLMPNIVVDGDVATLTLGQAGVPSFVSEHGVPSEGGPTFQAVALRYAWQDFPDCVLRNSEGFPAVPFQVSLVDKTVETVHRLKFDDEDGAASITIDGDSPLLDWQGRVDRSVLGRTSFDWVGTSVSVRLKGASVLRATFDCALKPPNAGKIRVFLHDDNDHGTTGKLQTYPWPASEHHLPGGNNTVVLAAGAGLSRTAVVTVFQNNNHEGSVGSRSISLVALETDGVFLPAVDSSKPQSKQRRITFIGDSITAATNNRRPYGDLSINGADGPIPFLAGAPTCADWTGLQGDYTLTYQAALCRNISNSNCTTVAVGGKGMYRNCCDLGPLWMPEYYQKLGMGDTGSTYTFPAEDAPDAVIINLGTNDFSGDSWRNSSDFQQVFTATYVEFMVNVTRWWKKNDIVFFAGVGPIQNEYLNATLAAVAGGKARGLQVHFLDQMGPPRDGCAGHPGIGGHAGMASMALEPLITTMGWKTDDLRAATSASYILSNRCGGAPAGDPTQPMEPDLHSKGVEIIFGDYNITACNVTAWTFRSLWHSGAAVLTPTGFTQTVSNVNLHQHACPPKVVPRATSSSEWTECLKIFGCAPVGLLEGGATVAECEAKCASIPNCTAFNVRMVKPGGCSLRHCPPGTLPTGTLDDFAGFANYPLKCEAWKPSPPHVKLCPEATTALWPPLRPVAQPIIPITPCGSGWGPQPGLPGGGPSQQGNHTCAGFLGTGHGGEYVYSVSLHAGGEVIDLLAVEPAATGKRWPTLADGRISIVKESQIGGYLATQNVTLSSSGMTVSANYTLAFDNTPGHVNYFYPSMTMFALPFKSWVAVTANGTEVNGTFLRDDSFTLKSAIQWVAVFDPASLRGAVYQYPVGHAYTGRAGFENSFWNRAYDHKLYLMVNVSAKFGTTKGTQFGFSHEVTAFTAGSASTWVADAKKLVKWPSKTDDELLASSGGAAASPDPLSPVMRAQLATYLRRVNAWVAESGVGNNNLSCGTMKDAIFINGNLARGLMAGFESLSNHTQLDIGLQWCDELVKLAYNTTSSDGSIALYWDTGYHAMFFGDTGTAMQALATGYRLAAKGSGGPAIAQARRTKYMWAMTGYLNYVTKGCAQAPQIPGFSYGNQTSKGWVNKDGSLGDGYCPPKGSGICFAAYSCATATTGAGAFGALATLMGSSDANKASAASVAQGAGRFLAGEVSGETMIDWNYDGTNVTVSLGGSGWIPQHWLGYPFGEGLVQAALTLPALAAEWARQCTPLAAYLVRSQHPNGYWGLNTTVDTPDLRRGPRVVTFLQWYYTQVQDAAVAGAINRYAQFLISDPLWYGVASDSKDIVQGVGPGLVTGFVSLAVADLLAWPSTFCCNDRRAR